MKRLYIIWAFLLLTLAGNAQDRKELVILHTNDTHSTIDPVKATEYRQRKNKSDDEACSMCGDYCAVKIVGQYLEEHMRKK